MTPRLAFVTMGLLLSGSCLAQTTRVKAGGGAGFISRADTPPRKVVVATVVSNFRGGVDERLERAAQLAGRAANEARKEQGRGPDLIVFPEFAFMRSDTGSAAERAVSLDSSVGRSLEALARRHGSWLVAPMILREADSDTISNAAVLFDRHGVVAGVFRKVHPVPDHDGLLEGGVTPGEAYPVFECDFGRLGILICWDMAYEDGWRALAEAGAEIIAVPSASPQTIRPSAEALRHHVYVVTSTPRNNATLFDPIGRPIAQAEPPADVLVHEIDLSYAMLHWSETLHEGRAFTERFGAAAGFDYSPREDTGIFWSNDPDRTIGSMVRELGLEEMPDTVRRYDEARKQ